MIPLFPYLQDFLKTPSERPKILIVTGPTASGKTAKAVRLAQEFSGEVINADSRQMYRLLQIGTAKPTPEEMEDVPHHLFDMLSPNEEGSVAIWRPLAEEKIADISGRGNLPILCGGTGLFLNALTRNFQIPTLPPQPEFRQRLVAIPPAELWKKLKAVDPAAAAKIHPHNIRLIIRALEIHQFSGCKKSDIANVDLQKYDSFFIGLTLEREDLYTKIDQRVEAMKANGFLEEVRNLLKSGYTSKDPALLSHGYPEAIRFLNGDLAESELWAKMKQNTRHYAKRQLTWWRRDPRVHWFHSENFKEIDITNSDF